jgi:hypothetical protein
LCLPQQFVISQLMKKEIMLKSGKHDFFKKVHLKLGFLLSADKNALVEIYGKIKVKLRRGG